MRSFSLQSFHRTTFEKLKKDNVTSIYEKNISAKVRLIHAEQMSLYISSF